jgi:uncharacterized protein YbjT (DUF2867 family)
MFLVRADVPTRDQVEDVMFVIAGVSGNTGKVVAESLLAQRRPVRVIVRSAAKGDEWKERGAEVAVAELDDVTGLTKAFTGATGAYLLLPPQMASSDSRADNAKRTAGFVKAISASDLGHVVFLSSVGAQHAAGTGPVGSLHDAEVALAQVKNDVTIVRAAYFLENWGGSLYALAQGLLPSFLKTDRAIPMVAAQDIGSTIARALVEGGHGHSVIELSGPRDYSPDDVAAALSRVVGKPITAQEGPEEAMTAALVGAGFNAHWAGLYQELTHGINVGHVDFERGAARAVRGTTPVDTVMKKLVG